MARQTTNYGLTKPDYTDIADIEVVNSNMDIRDEALKVIDTKSNNVMSKNSSAWSSTVAYAVGQYCIYNNSLWKCLVQHSGQTPQEGTYWARVSLDTLGSEINALNNNFTWKKADNFATAFNNAKSEVLITVYFTISDVRHAVELIIPKYNVKDARYVTGASYSTSSLVYVQFEKVGTNLTIQVFLNSVNLAFTTDILYR